jgi:hypothetical protein
MAVVVLAVWVAAMWAAFRWWRTLRPITTVVPIAAAMILGSYGLL